MTIPMGTMVTIGAPFAYKGDNTPLTWTEKVEDAILKLIYFLQGDVLQVK
jgi:hypothetical protein